MLYDNGGMGGPRPMPQLPLPKPRSVQQPLSPAGFKEALVARANAARKSMGVSQPFEFQKFRERPMGMAYAGQQQMVPRPQYQFGLPGMGMPPQGGVMGYRRRSRGANFGINGKPIGAWDYQQPMPQQQQPPMVGYGGYSQPQYYGNPFLPMVSY